MKTDERRMDDIGIFTARKPGYSETFIKAHLELLPAKIHHFYGISSRGYPPIYVNDDQTLFSDNIVINYLETLIDRLAGESGVGFYFRNKQIKKYFLENKVQVVLAEFGPVGTFVMQACKDCNIPLVVYFYGRDAYHYGLLKRFKSRYMEMFKIAHKVFVVSHDIGSQLIKLGLDPAKVVYNPCPPQSNFINLENSNKPPIFLAVGRFTAKKSPTSTIEAFAQVSQQVSGATLIMVGDGDLLQTCRDLTRRLHVEDKVSFVGSKTPEELAALYAECRVFVQHSVVAQDGDSEGTPVAVLEAMACGLPVVSTRHAGIKDVVVEGQTGFLVDEHDIDQMAEHMLKLAQDQELAYDMGQRGARRVQQHYTMKQHMKILWEELENAM